MERAQIYEIVTTNVKQLVDTFPVDQQFEVNEETQLFGPKSVIDSLSLVSVVVDLEMQLSDEYGKEISLTDDRAMTRKISPFDSVSTLTDYIHEILN